MSQRFNQIFSPHIQSLYALAYRWTQNQAEAEDLVQDLAIKLLPDVAKLESLDHPLSWMKKVLYRMFVDRYRRKQFSVVMPSDEVNQIVEDTTHAHDELADFHQNEQLQLQLLQALETLDAPQRVAVSLFEMAGYSLQEIADVQEVSVGTVKSRIHRAKAKLRQCVELEPFLGAVRDKSIGE